MSKKLSFSIILDASAKGLTAGFNKGSRAIKAFNKVASKGTRIMGNLEGAVVGIAGAFVGFQALTQAKQIMQDGEVAAYNLEASLRAANREFNDIGSMAKWEGAVSRISDKLAIFSNTEIRNATARTIDMTKRLGMSSDQMERMIELAGDLGAGKTTLEGSIERVTAALRGEAEASEYLGLTLNETYVKSWYNAHGAMQGAWKDLTDLQKAQERYNVFLEQAIPLQGRAAGMAKTFFGAMSLVKKSIHDSINDSENAKEAMSGLAEVLRENSGALGELTASMVSGVAKVVEFTIKHKDLLIAIGKGTAAIYLFVKAGQTIGLLINIIKGVNAATFVLAGTTLPRLIIQTQIASSNMGILSAATATFGTVIATVTGVVGAFFAGWLFGKLLNSFESVRVVSQLMFASLIGGFQMVRVEYYKLIQAGREFLGLDTTDIDRKVAAAQREVDINKMVMENLIKNGDKRNELDKQAVAGKTEIANATVTAGEKEKTATAAKLAEMKKQYQAYTDSIKKLQDEIAGREKSLAEELRAMGRSGMSDLGAWKDLKKEAQEYERAAVSAAKAGNFDEAIKLADKAKSKYKELNREVKVGDKVLISQKDALSDAMNNVKRTGELSIDILKQQKTSAEDAAKALDNKADGALSDDLEKAAGLAKDYSTAIKEATDDGAVHWGMVWDSMRGDAKVAIDSTEQYVIKMTKDREIKVDAKLTSGAKRILEAFDDLPGVTVSVPGYKTGTVIPGYGGGDRHPAMLESGEGVLNKEAVRSLGPGFVHLLNSLKSRAGLALRERVANISLNLPELPSVTQSPAMATGGGMMRISLDFKQLAAKPVTVMASPASARELQRQFAEMERLSS